MSENTITDESLDLAIEQLEDMEDGKLEKLFDRMAEQQPNIMGFVLGLGEGLKNEEAEEDLLFLVMIVWHAIELQKKSQDLAESIFNTTKIKFKEGIGSSFEMINAESELTQANTNYLIALYELNVARIDLNKALGIL